MKMRDIKEIMGFGVAGNFAGHLEQAGEASDFIGLKREIGAPKGIFPYYVPNATNFLSKACVDNEKIIIPLNTNVQVEPEIAVRFELSYDKNTHEITDLTPLSFMAFNDASVRGIKAPKISHKKNFGDASKGAGNEISIDKFSKGGICDDFSLASFLKRGDEILPYGECAMLSSYGYFYEKLLSWLKDTLNTQHDEAVLENLSELFKIANYPKQIIISLGATRYAPNMQNAYLQDGDEVFIIAFNHKKYNLEQIIKLIKDSKISANDDISVLNQRVQTL